MREEHRAVESQNALLARNVLGAGEEIDLPSFLHDTLSIDIQVYDYKGQREDVVDLRLS